MGGILGYYIIGGGGGGQLFTGNIHECVSGELELFKKRDSILIIK